MKISECMTQDVRLIDPDQTIRSAARLMSEIDAGVLPVGENDRLVGMITDRDIAVRAVAEGKSPDAKVREVMTSDLRYCFEDEELEAVLDNMAANQVRRMPVLSRQKRLVGIVSMGDLSQGAEHAHLGRTVSHVMQPGGAQSQASH